MNQCFCLRVCSDTGVELLVETHSLDQGPTGEAGAVHICAQNVRGGSDGVGGLVCGR